MRKYSHFNFAKIGSWNLHGAYYDVNGSKINKLEDPDFLDVLNDHDILCLQETQCGQNDLMDSHIHDFHGIPHCRKISNNNRYFGGMLLLIRKTIRIGIKIVSNDDPDILGVLLLKDFFGLPQDVTIWFVYASPSDSSYLTNRDDVLDCLERRLQVHENSLIFGDLNGKTNTRPDYVVDDSDKHSPISDIDSYVADSPLERNNSDTKPVDRRGKKILELCQSYSLRILNGRTAGDRWGHLTRFPLRLGETPSVLDYAICPTNLLKEVKSFRVYPLCHISDHCCISCKLETSREHNRPTCKMTNYNEGPKGPKFDIAYAETYTQNLDREPGFKEIDNALSNLENNPSQQQMDTLMDKFNESIIRTATKSFPAKKIAQPNKKIRKPARWFNDECAKFRKSHRRALAKLNKNPFNTHLQELALHARKNYKKACKEAEAELRVRVTKKLLDLNDKDPKQFWKLLKNMREWGREKPDPSDGIEPESWKQYYQSLLNKSSAQPLDLPQGQPNPKLDKPLMIEELHLVIKKAKLGKAFGPDGNHVEYIKFASAEVIRTLFHLMKLLFENFMFPSAWTVNYLRPIYKKDSKDDPDNYRGLAIASTISKLYCMILLQRLESHMLETGLISPNQIGFMKNCQAPDHVYLLKTLVTKVLKQKKKLYAAFIDFKKAYDTVDRSLLLKSVHTAGIQGKFLANLKAIYSKVSYSIKLKAGALDPIDSNLGLKQGCPLSPLLFNIYINDIGSYLQDNGPGNISIQGTRINHFLYADDLVLLSETKAGLQRHLAGLENFSKAKELTVNTKKSVVMVFNSAGRKSNEKFTYNNKELKTVQSFTYLGVEIAASGSFTVGIKNLCTKAKKAMIPLFRTIIQFRLPFRNALKLFLTFVEPILLYNAENWASMTDQEIKKCKNNHSRIYQKSTLALPSVSQLKFLKFILGVTTQCPTMAVLGETAQIPLMLKGYLRMLTYWDRLRDLDDNSLVKMAYLENVAMNTNWCQTIQVLNCSQGLHNNLPNPPNTKFKTVAKKRIKDNFENFWRNRIDNREEEKKLAIYSQVKNEFKLDDYLQLPHFRDRQRISKFITSSHYLEVEKGRHHGKPREERTCQACDQDTPEDEKHFLLHCPAYANTRKEHLSPINLATDSIAQVFTSNCPYNISQYLKAALDIRDKLVNFKVTKLSLCGMKMNISRGSDQNNNRINTKLQARLDSNLKLRISRKCKGPPRPAVHKPTREDPSIAE